MAGLSVFVLLASVLVGAFPVRFGEGVADLDLDDGWVVLAPRVALREERHALAWCSQHEYGSGGVIRCTLGRTTRSGTHLAKSALLADFPRCGGPGRLDFAGGPRATLVVTTTCPDHEGRTVHAGIDGGGLYTLSLREGRMDHEPRLVPAAGGGFWLLWATGAASGGPGEAVRAARLGSDARLVLGPLELCEQGEAWIPALPRQLLDLAPLSGGGFAAAWYGIPRYGGHAVRVRIFDALGMPATGAIDIPLEEEGADSIRVAVDGSDRITVVWQARERGWWRVFAASFSAAGEPLVPPQVVGTEPRNVDLRLPRIASTKTGQILVWLERDSAGRSWIAARKWSAARGPVGLVTRVEAEVARRWAFLEVAPVDAAGGSFRIYWNPDGPDGLTVPARVRWRELVLAPGTM